MSRDVSRKIRDKRARIAVIGLGHVGLPTAAIFADAGYSVTGADIRKQVVDAVSSLKLVTHEHGLDELVKRAVRVGKLKTTADTVVATKQADVVLICVQTPLAEDKKPDLKHLKDASRNVAKGLAEGKLVVVVSTVPPGAVQNTLVDILEKGSALKCGSDFRLAYCPERILPGNTIDEFIQNPRLVGGFDPQSTAMTVALFREVVKGKILATNIANAELAKLAENTFRYVNIAFANELALMCEKLGADIDEVINLANTHPRVNIHKPGPGVGGPCLTKDPQLLLHPEGHSPLKSEIIQSSEELNDYMAEHVVELVAKGLKGKRKNVKNCSVAVLGVAYKAQVSDTTNSPSEKIIRKLMRLVAEVRVYDPYTTEDFGAKRAKSLESAVKGTDCIVLATDHKMFTDIPLNELRTIMKQDPIIVDAKRILDVEKANKASFAYYGIGFGTK